MRDFLKAKKIATKQAVKGTRPELVVLIWAWAEATMGVAGPLEDRRAHFAAKRAEVRKGDSQL